MKSPNIIFFFLFSVLLVGGAMTGLYIIGEKGGVEYARRTVSSQERDVKGWVRTAQKNRMVRGALVAYKQSRAWTRKTWQRFVKKTHAFADTDETLHIFNNEKYKQECEEFGREMRGGR